MRIRRRSRRGLVTPPLAYVLVASLGITSCGPRRELQNTFTSPEALAAAVLDGVARRDRRFLEALAVTEEEFRAVVWPGLPASRPERNLPWDYVWVDLHQKSRASLSEVLKEHGGRRYSLQNVTYLGDKSTYPGFEVRRLTRLDVRDETGRQVRSLRVFGATLGSRGRYKVFSYVVD